MNKVYIDQLLSLMHIKSKSAKQNIFLVNNF